VATKLQTGVVERAAGQRDERVVEAGLLHARVGGGDLMASQDGGHGLDEIAAAGHHDLGSGVGQARHLDDCHAPRMGAATRARIRRPATVRRRFGATAASTDRLTAASHR